MQQDDTPRYGFEEEPRFGYEEPTKRPRAGARKSMPWWGWLLIALGGGGLVSCVGCIGLLTWIGMQPTTVPTTHANVPAEDIAALEQAGLLDPGERIGLIGTGGLWSYSQDTYFFTDTKFVYYNNLEDPGTHKLVPFADIVDLRYDVPDSYFSDTVLEIERADGTTDTFLIKETTDDAQTFLDGLRRAWEQQKTP